MTFCQSENHAQFTQLLCNLVIQLLYYCIVLYYWQLHWHTYVT